VEPRKIQHFAPPIIPALGLRNEDHVKYLSIQNKMSPEPEVLLQACNRNL
jgi:hypothetical protein